MTIFAQQVDPNGIGKQKYRQILIPIPAKTSEILIIDIQMIKKKMNDETGPTLLLTPLDHFLKITTC